MKRIYVLRHGKTEHPMEDKEDHERVLLDTGRRDVLQIGLKMQDEGLLPEKIVSSTAKRARETANLCMDGWDIDKNLEVSHTLYSGLAEDYLEIIRSLPEKLVSVMIVGHNPTIEEFNEALSGSYTAVKPAHLLWYEVAVQRWTDIGFALAPVHFGRLTP